MIKYIQRIAQMDLRKAYKLSLIAVFGLTGCGLTWWGNENEGEVVYIDQQTTLREESLTPCEQPVRPVVVPPQEDDDMLIDYRRTTAEYRNYGERTPRDQFYTQGGAGNNMSAAIPPTIEEEVSDYETAVNSAFDQAIDDAASTDGLAGGDEAVEDWLAEEGATLRGLLSEWCERSGWRLVWNSNRNYTLAAGAMFRGRFADVASALIRTFARARPAPLATFYKGNRVLVVETKEDENAYN